MAVQVQETKLKKPEELGWAQKIAATVCDAAESYLNLWVPQKENMFLSGPFAPVEEGELAEDLPVQGTLPECLNGEFVRNGPNPRFKPTRGYHWFDGDGMLHGVRIKDGKANYVNRYVRTSRLAQEEAFGSPKFVKIGDMAGWVGIGKLILSGLRAKLNVLDVSAGMGTGNTSLVFHNGSLMATNEGDAPYIVKVLQDGELETVGRNTYGSSLQHSFTAHPKVDPVTGEMFTFGYNAEKPPFVKYRVVSPQGVMGDEVAINLPRPIMMHDFAITENYAIFMDLPVLFEPKEIVKSGFLFKYDPSIPARFGVIPRYAKSEVLMKWFTLPSHYVFHTANAWEEGDEVVLIACHIPHLELNKIDQSEQDVKHVSTLHEYRFNMATGESSMKQLADFFSDFPRINEAFLGRKQRYVYCAVMRATKIVGVAKYDLSLKPLPIQENSEEQKTNPQAHVGGTCVAYFTHGPDRFGSEPVFVAHGGPGEFEEDDGYLLNFVHDEARGVSEMVVIDAKTMNVHPVAVVTLPRRVPYGFHGIFVNEEQLKAQS